MEQAEAQRATGFPIADLTKVANRLLCGVWFKVEKVDEMPSWAALSILLTRLRTGAPYYALRKVCGFMICPQEHACNTQLSSTCFTTCVT